MRFYTPQIALLLLYSLLFSSTALPFPKAFEKPMPENPSSSVEMSEGLTTAVFKTDSGTIRFNLPDDMIAGDTLTGTVYVQPSGRDQKQKQQNLERLNSHSIEVAGKVSSVATRIFTFELPITGSGVKFQVLLRDPKGKRVSSIDVPLSNAFLSMDEGKFQIPEGGQTGRWINLNGSFDGDISNTELSIGSSKAIPLAESPRKSVFQSPSDVIGPTHLTMSEGNTKIVRVFRNVDVSLTAAKLQLSRGEITRVSLNVSGLQGIEEDLPLHLTCTGSADMQGGNIQNMQISPSEVNSEGQFIQTRTLVGNQIGNFTVNATVLFDAGVRVLDNNLVHIEGTPQKMSNVWGVRVKTLDGKIKWIFFTNEPPPGVKSCLWIRIKKSETEDDGDVTVSDWEPADDPTKPCMLENKTVHIEGSPLKMPDGRWQIKIELPGGGTGYIYVRAPTKPDLKLCNWIKVSGCNKLSNNSFEVGGYDVTEDPNKPPPATVVTPPPTPTPTPTPKPSPRASVVKPCTNGETRPLLSDTKDFKILSKGSQLKFSITTSNSGNGIAADGMAKWLSGLAELGSILTGQFVPDDQAVGGGVADAVLKYVELGGDISSAIAKSNFRNLNTLWIEGTLSTRLILVTATCREYEVCIDGRWVKKKAYSEERQIIEYTDKVRIKYPGNDWDQVSNRSRPQSVNIEKAEKFLLGKLLQRLKDNELGYGEFKKKCK